MWKSAIVAPPSNMCVLSFMRSRLSAELALERLELPCPLCSCLFLMSKQPPC